MDPQLFFYSTRGEVFFNKEKISKFAMKRGFALRLLVFMILLAFVIFNGLKTDFIALLILP
ncbi:hypothetical protein BBV17_16535 [Cytobacillus oceanisediminis]|uniref:Uncharacterized protein n=1 Tax=Cytobacillus oceanisediminis TaxID=665099 RepID=A0ABX3CSU1_9BACI|nr:hypothetical protein BBV17_16535 [Cytobacillus oceanisediminis]